MLNIQDRITTEEYEALLALPENTDRLLELIDGEIIEKMPGQLHGYIVWLLSGFLFNFLRANPTGYVTIETRHRRPDSDHHLIPDLAFVTHDRGGAVQAGAVPHMPDLAVEVQSPGQSERFMLDKALLYLASGARMVWLIYPERQIVETLTLTERQLLTAQDQLTGGDVLPGFSVAISELFPPAAE